MKRKAPLPVVPDRVEISPATQAGFGAVPGDITPADGSSETALCVRVRTDRAPMRAEKEKESSASCILPFSFNRWETHGTFRLLLLSSILSLGILPPSTHLPPLFWPRRHCPAAGPGDHLLTWVLEEGDPVLLENCEQCRWRDGCRRLLFLCRLFVSTCSSSTRSSFRALFVIRSAVGSTSTCC